MATIRFCWKAVLSNAARSYCRASSNRWKKRQATDLFVRDARAQGYPSRAAFKLEEILQKERKHMKPFRRVLDLGASPGGWTSVISRHLTEGKGYIVALDRSIPPHVFTSPAVRWLEMDLRDASVLDCIRSAATTMEEGCSHPSTKAVSADRPFDMVLCDAAPDATGQGWLDHTRLIELADIALDIGNQVLREGGTFIVKINKGGEEGEFLDRCKQLFSQAKYVKPKASRQESREVYVVATGQQAVE